MILNTFFDFQFLKPIQKSKFLSYPVWQMGPLVRFLVHPWFLQIKRGFVMFLITYLALIENDLYSLITLRLRHIDNVKQMQQKKKEDDNVDK